MELLENLVKTMNNPKIAFDEAGNTGQNLLDPSQPVFILASLYLTDSETSVICNLVDNSDELHFKKLRHSFDGRNRIIDILRSPLLNQNNLKVTLIDKPFMVTTKIVDLLIESLAYRDGFDLYERGGNIAMSNLIHFVTGTLCGQDNFISTKQAFVRMIRSKSFKDIKTFYDSINRLYKNCSDEDYKSILGTIAATRDIINDVLQHVNITELDPAVPSFSMHCNSWSNQLSRPFDIIHDQSKAIAFDKNFLERFMDPIATNQEIFGTDRRTVKLPYLATGIKLVDSRMSPQIQIADLIASSFAYWLNHRNEIENDKFVASIAEIFQDPETKGWLIGGIWPRPEVDPKALGTDGPSGENLADGMGRFLKNQRYKKENLL
jgi:hypothetical protein